MIYGFYTVAEREAPKRHGHQHMYNACPAVALLRTNHQIYNELVHHIYNRRFSIGLVYDGERVPWVYQQIADIFKPEALKRIKFLDLHIFFHLDATTIVSGVHLDCLKDMTSLKEIAFLIDFDRDLMHRMCWPELDYHCRFPSPLLNGLVVGILSAVPRGVEVQWKPRENYSSGKQKITIISERYGPIGDSDSDEGLEDWGWLEEDDFRVPHDVLQRIARQYRAIQGSDHR